MTELTKWPRLLVVGQNITPEQADEVLIRTANPRLLQVNDQAWNATVARVLGLELGKYGHATTESVEEAVTRYGFLELVYLYTSRIASSWIGGPHGWCDWDGRIGCSTYNIGKWPDLEDVTEDWKLIAREFPYLNLTAQLVTEEGEGDLAAEWRVQAGRAELVPVGAQITDVTALGAGDLFGRLLVGGERGVPEDRLATAAARVQAGLDA